MSSQRPLVPSIPAGALLAGAGQLIEGGDSPFALEEPELPILPDEREALLLQLAIHGRRKAGRLEDRPHVQHAYHGSCLTSQTAQSTPVV